MKREGWRMVMRPIGESVTVSLIALLQTRPESPLLFIQVTFIWPSIFMFHDLIRIHSRGNPHTPGRNSRILTAGSLVWFYIFRDVVLGAVR